ncbi:uncharacterized protein G2W53_018660 [Senna tora]|uniref:Uncharacterized protein n=1 Tax=Senna tora TaxID=362788 RepID=A0A834WQ18_9FABA|nr:uncharacterized protein G2W53_018660 [Senna tora]
MAGQMMVVLRPFGSSFSSGRSFKRAPSNITGTYLL